MRLITIDDAMKVFDDFTRGDLPTEDLLNLRIMLEEKEIPSAEPYKGMTNGEVIKTVFPNIDTNFSNVIDLKLWWDAKYKAERSK